MAGKLGTSRPQVLVGRQHFHAAFEVLARAGLLPLVLHLPLEAGHIHVETVLAGDLRGQLGWEPVGVVKHERIPPGYRPRRGPVCAVDSLAGDHIQQNVITPSESLGKPFLLQVDHSQDEPPVLGQLSVDGLEPGNDLPHHLAEERPGQPQPPAVADCPPYDPPQHVASALVARHHAIADEKRRGPGVLGDDPQREVGTGIGAVLPPGQMACPGDDGCEQVGLVDVVLALQDYRCALQPHAGIHAGGGQWRAVALRVLVELHEHQVPQLHEPFAVAVGMAPVHLVDRPTIALLPQLRRQDVHLDHPAAVAAPVEAAIVVDFRTGSGRTLGACRSPPVVLVSIAIDAVNRNADLVVPDLEGLVVVQVNGDVKAVRRQAEQLRDQLPSVGDSSLLEIVSDAEVPQHLEERKVLVIAHFVDVRGAKTLLAAGEPSRWRCLLSHEKRFEGHHSGAGEQQRGVARRDQRGRGHVLMPLALKILDERVPYLVAVHQP